MLSYKNENGNVKELAAGGTMGDLLAESAYLLTAVYGMLARRDKAAAEIFKVSMMMAVGDPESPVWKNIEPDRISIAQRVKPKEGKSDDKWRGFDGAAVLRKRQLRRVPAVGRRSGGHDLRRRLDGRGGRFDRIPAAGP